MLHVGKKHEHSMPSSGTEHDAHPGKRHSHLGRAREADGPATRHGPKQMLHLGKKHEHSMSSTTSPLLAKTLATEAERTEMPSKGNRCHHGRKVRRGEAGRGRARQKGVSWLALRRGKGMAVLRSRLRP